MFMGRRRGKKWNSCLIWFLSSLGALCLSVSCIGAAVNEENVRSSKSVDVPMSCSAKATGNAVQDIANRHLILVSTLDGKMSALDVKDNGRMLWSIDADSRPLLSSSISKLEIMHDGIPNRYIPSLDGGLYRYDGESIEAVPMTADTLLSSSFRMMDNTVMIGSKDLKSYGIDPKSGMIRYTCTSDGCSVFGEDITDSDDILIITRNTQTVRAVDSRSGGEKWNFSVGQHQASFIKGQRQAITTKMTEDEDISIVSCPSSEDEGVEFDSFDGKLKILVPDGVIVGLGPDDNSIRWRQQFSTPVANAWILHKGELQAVDMFDTLHIPALSDFEPKDKKEFTPPLLYVGMHHSQLYVQPSPQMQERVSMASQYPTGVSSSNIQHVPSVAWKPYLNTASFRTPHMMADRPQITYSEHSDKETCEEERNENAMIVWSDNYPFDAGYYLYDDRILTLNLQEDRKSNDNKEADTLDSMFDVIPVSLWNWWKEVLAISIISSIVVHFALMKLTHSQPQDQNLNENASSDIIQRTNSEKEINEEEEDKSKTPSRQNSNENKEYVSRYLSDFEHIQVLGKGGFGIVYEAKNKVDDCLYAVKRIEISHSETSKEKVMREVKALAKLDHMGIVRFFNAWIETPPTGWQEGRDREIEDSECMSRPTPCNSVTELGAKTFIHQKKRSPFDNLLNPFGSPNLEFSYSQEERKGGSTEFHQSDFTEENEEESGSFSLSVGSPKDQFMAEEQDTDIVEFGLPEESNSVESSGNSSSSNNNHIPDCFWTNKSSKHNIDLADHSDSFMIVFEDSGCADKSSKSSNGDSHVIDIHTSQSNGSVFTHSSKPVSRNTDNLIQRSDRASSDKKGDEQEQKVVQRLENFQPKVYVYIQMQLCKRETLKDWLNANSFSRDLHFVLDIFDQIVSAVEYIHDCHLMHRDLKPSNIFFALDGVVKVGDFGLVTALVENQQTEEEYRNNNNPYKKHTAQVGTQLYMSPEQSAASSYSQKVDIFALGMILFELLYPFSTQMERINTLLRVRCQTFPERFIEEMPKEKNFVSLLVEKDPDQRPSARQILDSNLLKQFEQRRLPRRYRTISTSSSGSENHCNQST
ncbi:hypothetical protein CHS0354_041095 [Potamilus streckersoni]|uniref:non-specific serine/threonine protein kinase n=1 Tax=Potamilus streckersoni TaxID=2493646 RepID=A0AAE0SEN1_9BIVA|nr:hypothetical protein CHS0354_041095 [Potamilus streckersoni]